MFHKTVITVLADNNMIDNNISTIAAPLNQAAVVHNPRRSARIGRVIVGVIMPFAESLIHFRISRQLNSVSSRC